MTPTIGELANIIPQKPDWRQTWLIRQERIKKEGSEYFTWIVPVTAATAISHIEIAESIPRARKYLPLDFCEVVNNDVVDISLIINGRDLLSVPSGTIRTSRMKALWEIAIRNDSTTTGTTLNSIITTLRREPITIDDWARRQK